MKLELPKTPINWRAGTPGLVILGLILFSIVAGAQEERSNALSWLIIILFTGFVLWSTARDPFQFTGISSYIFTLRGLKYLILLATSIQIVHLLIYQGLFARPFGGYDFFYRLTIIWESNTLPQGIGEELVFRLWVLLPFARRSWQAFWGVNIIQSSLFTLFHLDSPAYALFAFVFALLSGYMTHRSRSILPAALIHTASPLFY